MTGGRIWEAAFVAARDVGRVHPGGWDHVLVVLLGLINRTAGLIVLLSAVGLARVGASPGIGRKVFLVTGLGLIVLIIVTLSLHSFWNRVELGVVVAFAACTLMGVVFPACALIERSPLLGNRIDAALWVYTAVEFGLAIVFFYLSTGSWMNYAIQSDRVRGGVDGPCRVASRAGRRGLPGSCGRWPWPLLQCSFPHTITSSMPRCRCAASVPPRRQIFERPESACLGVLLHRPSGLQPGRRAARAGLRRLALSGIRVAAPGRAPLGVARSIAPIRPGARRRGDIPRESNRGHRPGPSHARLPPRHQRRPVLRLDPVTRRFGDRPGRLCRSPPFRLDSPGVTIVGTR